MRGDANNQACRAQWSCYLLWGVSCNWRVVGQRQSCWHCWLAGVFRQVVQRSNFAALVALSVVHTSTRMRKLSSSWNVCRRCWNVVWSPWRIGSRSCGIWSVQDLRKTFHLAPNVQCLSSMRVWLCVVVLWLTSSQCLIFPGLSFLFS